MDSPSFEPTDEYIGYLNRSYSRSGNVPSVGELDAMIQSGLARATQRLYANKQIAFNKQQLNERKREFDSSINQMESDRLAQSATGLLSTATQLGTAYMLDDPRYLKHKVLGYNGGYYED